MVCKAGLLRVPRAAEGKADMRLAGMAAASAAVATVIGTAAAVADEIRGIPVPGGAGFQPASTPVMYDLIWLDSFIHWIMFAIVVLVTGLILYALWRFSEKKNPEPAKFTHNSRLEVAWTAIPVVILVIIAIPSLQLLSKQVVVPEADITIKATGHQWYWSHEYPDHEFEIDSFMVAPGFASFDVAMADEQGRAEIERHGVTRETWLLQTDTEVVVPVGQTVRLLVTASDVIHSWAMPAFGVKMDGIPGRLNETWFRVDYPGVYYGQCSELCGKDHSYMPITVRAVPQEEYEAWLVQAAETYAGIARPVSVADAGRLAD